MSDDQEVFRLCYIDGNKAFFTTQEVKDQWGDDWNDAPYEHNAGRPYTYSEHDRKEGKKAWRIKACYFETDLETPEQIAGLNSWVSVESINAGACPWLISREWSKTKVMIPAGTTYEDFVRLIREGGGSVWEEVTAA